jgi:hypothetical protein
LGVERVVLPKIAAKKLSRQEALQNEDTTQGMSNLGITLGEERKLKESEQVLREALVVETKARGEQSPLWRLIMANLGSTLAYANREADAIAVFTKLIANASKPRAIWILQQLTSSPDLISSTK